MRTTHPPHRTAPPITWSAVSALITDVDESLITDKSMRSFLQQVARPLLDLDPSAAWEHVQRAGATGDRDAANAAYYSLFAGQPEHDLLRAGEEWFRSVDRPDWWIRTTLDLCTEASSAAVPIVLVSGSHHACLDPIARRRADRAANTFGHRHQ